MSKKKEMPESDFPAIAATPVEKGAPDDTMQQLAARGLADPESQEVAQQLMGLGMTGGEILQLVIRYGASLFPELKKILALFAAKESAKKE